MQQASYLEGGPLMWMLPLYLHVNQKFVDDDDDNDDCVVKRSDLFQKMKNRDLYNPQLSFLKTFLVLKKF